jgi:hypothetical protein
VTADGRILGMTHGGRLFEFHTGKQMIRDLGPNFLTGEYTAAMVSSPDEKYLYFAPGAHSSAPRIGTPVVQYEIATGKRKVIAFLLDEMTRRVNYYIGGTYNMQLDGKGDTLYCTFNGSRIVKGKDPKPFGQPSLVILRIPESERK